MSPRILPVERFWAKVDLRPELLTGCWIWHGAVGSGGYGNFWDGERSVNAHRFAFRTAHSREAKGVVMHSCDNRLCVNPAHLSEGASRDNNRDTVAKGRTSRQRQTHCKNGHEFTPENTFRQSNGSRGCRTCQRQWGREYKERQRSA